MTPHSDVTPGNANFHIGVFSVHRTKHSLGKELSAEVIRPPSLNHLLDGFALRHFFVEHLPRQPRQFGIAGKSQRYELTYREFHDPWLQICRQHALITQPLFQPDHAVLHFQRHHSHAPKSHEQSERQQYPYPALPRKSSHIQTVTSPEKIDGHHRQNEKVKRREQSPMIRKTLFSHDCASSCAADCSKALHARAGRSFALLFSVFLCALCVEFFGWVCAGN